MKKALGIPTPELDKMRACSDMSQGIGAFLDWLSDQRIQLCEYAKIGGRQTEELWPISEDIERILARYFEIDLKKVDQEKRAILEEIRKRQP